MRDVHAPSLVVLTIVVLSGLAMFGVSQYTHAQATTIEQRSGNVAVAASRRIRFVCDQKTLPNDMASCMARAVRLYFEGDWTGVDACGEDGTVCTDLGKLRPAVK